MKVKEMIEKLKKYPANAEVIISDGYKLMFWSGDFVITKFENKVDIGVGGCDEKEES